MEFASKKYNCDYLNMIPIIKEADELIFNLCAGKYVTVPILIQIINQLNTSKEMPEFLVTLLSDIYKGKSEEFS